jgi:hypothetical protein
MTKMILFASLLGVASAGHAAAERFTCNLSALTKIERARDHELMMSLASAVVEKRELPDGYAFRFDRAKLSELAEWTDIIAKCCQPLTYQIEVGPQPGGALWARFTGKAGVKEFLDGELDEFFRRMPASATAHVQ